MDNKFKNILKKHAKSFYFAGLLLNKETLNDASILYAFCRQLDDAADHHTESESLNNLNDLIEDYKQQSSQDSINKAFKEIQKKYDLKQKFIDDLIQGLSSDINFKQPENVKELMKHVT